MRDRARFSASRNCSIVLGCADGHAECVWRAPAAAHGANDDSVSLQFLAEAGGFFADPAEQEICPRRRYADAHLRDGFGQKLRARGVGFHRALHVVSIRQRSQSCRLAER